METKFLSNLPELIIEQSAKNNRLGRNIRVDEVGPAIEYLLSDAVNAMTGGGNTTFKEPIHANYSKYEL